MRSVTVLAIAAGLLLAGAARPALAGPSVPTPDSAAAAETSLRAPAVRTPGLPPLPLDVLRDDIGRSRLTLWIGQDRYEIRHARLEPVGVAFDPGDPRALPSRPAGGGYWEERRPSLLPSPIGWDRIDRVETMKPCALRGAIVGGLVGAAACAALFAWAAESNEEMGTGALALFALPPVGVVLGGGVGALMHHSKRIWHRVPSAPGAAR